MNNNEGELEMLKLFFINKARTLSLPYKKQIKIDLTYILSDALQKI